MLLNSARLPARVDDSGNLRSLFEQDRSRWDRSLIADGERLLNRAAVGPELTEYHIEAAIAAVHANARGAADTDWPQIVALYDTLLRLRPSPVVKLNRAIAIGQDQGPERGLEAIRAIDGSDRLSGYPFYFAAIGELELRLHRLESAREQFQAAIDVARSSMERRFFEQRLSACS